MEAIKKLMDIIEAQQAIIRQWEELGAEMRGRLTLQEGVIEKLKAKVKEKNVLSDL